MSRLEISTTIKCRRMGAKSHANSLTNLSVLYCTIVGIFIKWINSITSFNIYKEDNKEIYIYHLTDHA